jgi:hypothetical protein
MRLARIEESAQSMSMSHLQSISVLRLALVLAYDAAFTLPALTALPLVLTYTGIRTLQVGRKKAGVGAGQGAKN